MTIKIIAAVSTNGVIGKNQTLPWEGKYREDMLFFRKMTANSTIICGRSTFESFGSKPLPKRRNIIITRQKLNNVECYSNLKDAICRAEMQELDENSLSPLPIWLIGGNKIYEAGMAYASEIYLTLIPEEVQGDNLVYFPFIRPDQFKIEDFISLENSTLKVAKYIRI